MCPLDALAVLTAMCAVDVDVRKALTLTDRLHLSAMLSTFAIAVEDDRATQAEEAALRDAVRVLTGTP